MAISFASYDIDFELLEPQRIKQWIKTIIQQSNCRVGSIGYLFCSDDHLITINRQFLNHDTFTDIITFDYVECDRISGDIMISIDRVRENAGIFGVPFDHELHRVIIHGILHLLGQGDKSEEEAAQMRSKEERALIIWESVL